MAAADGEYEKEKSMRCKLIPAFLFLISLQACMEDFDEKEEAAVYNSYINNYYLTAHFEDQRFENRPFTTVVVSNRTSGYVVPFSYQSCIASLDPRPEETTIDNFLKRNNGYYAESQITQKMLKTVGRYPINPYIMFKLPHILISDEQIDAIFKNEKWDEFYRRYPNSRGIVLLSRVGFNKNKTQALLYFVKAYDGGASEGFLILLAKKDKGWDRIAQVDVWMS